MQPFMEWFAVGGSNRIGRRWPSFARWQSVGSITPVYDSFPMADVVHVVGTDDPVRPLFTAAGELKADARSGLGLDAASLRDLYQKMILIRRADQVALNRQRPAQLGLWGQYLGQEAIHVGAVAALEANDWIFPSYREFGMAMCRGVDPAE